MALSTAPAAPATTPSTTISRRMLRRFSLLLALFSAVFALAGSGSAGSTPGVWVVGDSLAKGTLPYLPQYLQGWSVRQTTRVGLHLSEGVATIRAGAGTMPAHVVVSLGTNDDPRLVASFRQGVRTVVDTAGAGRCVVWLNIVRPRTLGTSYDGYNRALRAESALHRSLHVIDWAEQIQAHPEWLRADGVHLTAPGYAARAAVIAHALRGC
jgi:lysophospholipase L1-like esterase